MKTPKRLMMILVSSLALAYAGIASAETFTVGNLQMEIDGTVSPTKLPKKKMAPVKLMAEAHLDTLDSNTPPVTQNVVVDFDKNGTVYTKGLPKCDPSRLENQTTEVALRRCRKALVGRGQTTAIVDFPDQAPFEAAGPLLAFNGKPQGRNPTIVFHVFANVPAPTAFVVPSVISNAPGTRFGKRVTVNVPTISGGWGTLTDFEVTINRKWKDKKALRKVKKLKRAIRKASGAKKRRLKRKLRRTKSQVKRSYLLARCANRRFIADTTVTFSDSTVINGGIVRPCQPKRG